eukprot:CAMPEP_0176479610 /NCGR_PEP_ID=MMETSP0200_2-20121128/1832_1 /TAXON_ID=947934 /ORGANISM="Chaetoceros sp., Strain GSL56" /LENGTH=310 /DNA_ID=CAMNT_0017875667 /DNA_START=353 /DNA_END=1282 /DNA_ORIENTATION=+
MSKRTKPSPEKQPPENRSRFTSPKHTHDKIDKNWTFEDAKHYWENYDFPEEVVSENSDGYPFLRDLLDSKISFDYIIGPKKDRHTQLKEFINIYNSTNTVEPISSGGQMATLTHRIIDNIPGMKILHIEAERVLGKGKPNAVQVAQKSVQDKQPPAKAQPLLEEVIQKEGSTPTGQLEFINTLCPTIAINEPEKQVEPVSLSAPTTGNKDHEPASHHSLGTGEEEHARQKDAETQHAPRHDSTREREKDPQGELVRQNDAETIEAPRHEREKDSQGELVRQNDAETIEAPRHEREKDSQGELVRQNDAET